MIQSSIFENEILMMLGTLDKMNKLLGSFKREMSVRAKRKSNASSDRGSRTSRLSHGQSSVWS